MADEALILHARLSNALVKVSSSYRRGMRSEMSIGPDLLPIELPTASPKALEDHRTWRSLGNDHSSFGLAKHTVKRAGGIRCEARMTPLQLARCPRADCYASKRDASLTSGRVRTICPQSGSVIGSQDGLRRLQASAMSCASSDTSSQGSHRVMWIAVRRGGSATHKCARLQADRIRHQQGSEFRIVAAAVAFTMHSAHDIGRADYL